MPYDDDRDPYEPRPRRRRPSQGTGTLSYLVALFVGFALGGLLLWAGSRFFATQRDERPVTDPSAMERPVAPSSPLDAEETRDNRIFNEATPSVVNVDTVVRRRDFGRIREQKTGTGSGFVWDKQGRIVTNFHVIQNAGQNGAGIRVVMPNHKEYDAAIVGVAPDFDLAVLQIPAPKDDLVPIKVGTSNDLKVGQKVFAIGNPFGLDGTMTKGIISAVHRTIESPSGVPISDAIQTDAAINPGNSGGPLLDKEGRLIGVNQSITTPSGGNVGIGFAIPVDTVNARVTELIRHGEILTPDMGVKLYDEARLRQAGEQYRKGVMIEDVKPSGPAAVAGLRGVHIDPNTGRGLPGDMILAINGEAVNGMNDFKHILRGLPINENAKLHIRRGDKEFDVDIVVQGA